MSNELHQIAFAKAHIASLEAALQLTCEQLQQARVTANYYQDGNKRLAAQVAALEFELLKMRNKLAFAEERNYVDGWVRMEEVT